MMSRKPIILALALLALAACSPDIKPCAPPAPGDVVYVVGQGWHAELGLPVEELDGPLAFFRKTFPAARVIMFGYGKKTFVTAPPESISEYVLGPVPGPAVIHVVGLSVPPVQAYPPGDTVTLALSESSRKALSQFIWNDLVQEPGGLRFVAPSTDPDGLFYAANSQYNLLHTCNSWTASALEAAGLPVSADGVVFSGQVMGRVVQASQSQCSALGRN